MHLKNNIIKKLKEESKRLTHGAVKLLAYLAKYCDDTGLTTGVSYRDFCNETGMCKQSFYNSKDLLCKLGFVVCEKNYDEDIDVLILNNSILTFDERKEGYVAFDKQIFFCDDIWKLTGNEIILCLEFLKNGGANKSVNGLGSFRKDFKDFFEEFTHKFDISKTQLRAYLRALRQFFSIGKKGGIIYATPLKDYVRKYRTNKVTSIDKLLAIKAANTVIRRAKLYFIKGSKDINIATNAISELFIQYKHYILAILGGNMGKDKSCVQYNKSVCGCMQDAVGYTISFAKDESKEDYLLKNIKFLHKNLRKSLGL